MVLEGLPKGPELFIIAVCIDGDLLDQFIQCGKVVIVVVFGIHRIPYTKNPLIRSALE